MSEIAELLTEATRQLAETSDSARADSEILLAHCLQKSRTYLLTWPEKEVDTEAAAKFEDLLAKRLKGIPIAYLTGQREFWTLNLKVTPDTLIPRPETELLVETALALLPEGNSPCSPFEKGEAEGIFARPVNILELGTGTGAIALSIASERPDAQLTATDLSESALQIARENAQAHHSSHIRFIQSDWFDALSPQTFDLIVSNPPYIEADDPHLQQGDVRFEPLSALTSGKDGLDDIRHLISTAPQWLEHGGWLLLEHGYNQGIAVTSLLQDAGFRQVRCLQDLAGNDRVSLGQWVTRNRQ